MHFRRLAALTLGAWLAGSLLVALFTAHNARVAGQILARPPSEAVDVIVKLQPAELRMLLDYHATEGNQWLRGNWETVQFGLGLVTLAALFLGSGRSPFPIVVCLLMIGTVAFLHFFMTPQIRGLAVMVDFLRPDQSPAARDRLHALETGYSIADNVKLLLGAMVAISLLRRRRRSQREVRAG
jgi:hypothetical protein